MSDFRPDRGIAYDILREYVKNESSLRHARAMEAVMEHFARMFDPEDTEKWAVIGLLHDIDYERYPHRHCAMVREILGPHGFPEAYLRAIESHGYRLTNDVEPVETMEKVLYATDELTGLIIATVLLRPGKSIQDLKVSSVKKKWKQKGFAAGVDREVIAEGAKMLKLGLDALIGHTIKGMQAAAQEIGLQGETQN